jgi:hypothetical protein
VDKLGEFGACLFCPTIGELVVVALAEVVSGGISEEGLGEVQADAEAACVHSGLQHCLGGWASMLVAVEELGSTGQVLGDPAVRVCTGEGVGQQPVTIFGESLGRGQSRGIESIGYCQEVAGE